MSQIIIGYMTEGSTDRRFLQSIIERTFVSVGFECNNQIEVISPIVEIEKPSNTEFVAQIFEGSKLAREKGVMVLCIHVDADARNDDSVFQHKITPALNMLERIDDDSGCRNLVAVVPVHMTESWMLADKSLLKDEIGTGMSDTDLGISKNPEVIADPKAVISNAIRIARTSLPRRRRKDLCIAELYQPIGQKVALERLENLPSFRKFEEAVRGAYRLLNYL
jgi:hypothetical protein